MSVSGSAGPGGADWSGVHGCEAPPDAPSPLAVPPSADELEPGEPPPGWLEPGELPPDLDIDGVEDAAE